MSRTRQVTLQIGQIDWDMVEAIRAEHGLSRNAAIRYAIRYHAASQLAGPAKRKAMRELEAWAEDMRNNRRHHHKETP